MNAIIVFKLNTAWRGSASKIYTREAMLLRTFLICLALLSSTTVFAQTPKTSPLYEERKIHDPNGIGKFFKGREIAHVMGYQAAGWLERPER